MLNFELTISKSFVFVEDFWFECYDDFFLLQSTIINMNNLEELMIYKFR